MTFKESALSMWPCWVLGAVIIMATLRAGHQKLLRIDPKALIKWFSFLMVAAVLRYVSIRYLLAPNAIGMDKIKIILGIPWASTLFVYWEDAVFGLPILLIKRLLPKKKWATAVRIAAMPFFMVPFALGHAYQGMYTVLVMLLYVPITNKIAEKNGYGTVMIGHILFDLTTILSLALAVRGLG